MHRERASLTIRVGGLVDFGKVLHGEAAGLEGTVEDVLASVPDKTQAYEAVVLAQVPQKDRVSRAQVKAPDAG